MTLAVAEPPAPEQASVNEVPTEMADEASEPEVARVPVQPPEAVQLVAPVVFQVSDVVAPVATTVGFADKVTVGSARVMTGTCSDALAPPPGP